MNHLCKLRRDFVDRQCRRIQGDPINQGRALLKQFLFCDRVPDRQETFPIVVHVLSDEAVEFVLRPILREEGLREHNDPKAAPRDPLIDLAAEAVTNLQLELVVPDIDIALVKGMR